MSKISNKTKGLALLTTTTLVSYKLFTDKLFNTIFNKNEKINVDDTRYKAWLNNSKRTKVYLKSYDGLKLAALKIENHDTNNYIILVHGIYSNHKFVLDRAYEFDKLGYNLLLIDQRAAGESEGEYYSYGLKESFDVVEWIEYLRSRNNNINIILYGVSMGAATIMQTCRFKLPTNVKCLVEDCGFSTMKDEVSHVLKTDYKIIQPGLVLKLLEMKMYNKFGFKFDDISAKKSLRNNEIPILFIHGCDDNYVPFKMATILYNNNKGYKKYYPVKDKKHAKAHLDPKYYINIDNFIRSVL